LLARGVTGRASRVARRRLFRPALELRRAVPAVESQRFGLAPRRRGFVVADHQLVEGIHHRTTRSAGVRRAAGRSLRHSRSIAIKPKSRVLDATENGYAFRRASIGAIIEPSRMPSDTV